MERVKTVREELLYGEEEKIGTATGAAKRRASSTPQPTFEHSHLTLNHSRLRHPELAWRHTIALLLAHAGYQGNNTPSKDQWANCSLL